MKDKIEVAVVTTSGRWPNSGFDEEPPNQKVRVALEKAAKHLSIVDTTDWMATVNGTEINKEMSFSENGLTGRVTIDFGPRRGGGGA